MELRMNWLRIVCVGALAFGMVLTPLTASGQDKKQGSAKGHQISHTKKAHKRSVRHVRSTRKAQKITVTIQKTIPAPVETVRISIPVIQTGPVAGTPYDEAAWRGFHSDWNGQYHFSNGKYYYDAEFKYPAQIPNDFNSIAARFGGAAILDNDPTLIFSGDSGEMYPVLQYNADRYNSDKKLKLSGGLTSGAMERDTIERSR